MLEIQMLTAWVTAYIQQDRTRNERGEIAQTVIIVAVMAAAAIAITAIIVKKFTDKATTIPTD